MATEYNKPLPTPSANSQPFWDATKEHKLMFQRCRKCGTRVFYPRDICPGPNCFGVGTLEWIESSGHGRVYSYTITHNPHPAFADDAPYAIGIVEMDEGWRMMTNIINVDPKDIQLGMRVGVVYDDVTPEFTLPKFQPI
jgi:uncharacterized OB-fold protein